MRALVISWKRYVPYAGISYRVAWEAWLKNFSNWANEIDTFYLIDQDMNFSEEDHQRLTAILPNSFIIKSESQDHHWAQFKNVIPKIKEDNILFLDNDVIIKKGTISGWFELLKDKDIVTSFDGSGGLKEQVQSKFPFMKDKGTRMGSPYILITKSLLDKVGEIDWAPITYPVGTYIPELDYTTVEGDWSDSFGLFTIKVLGLETKIDEIADPRDSIYLDTIILKSPETPLNLGYYHIRNGNLANYVLTSKTAGNMNDYWREVGGNKRELLRSLAWFDWMDDGTFKDEVLSLVKDLGRTQEEWENYMIEFKTYHNL